MSVVSSELESERESARMWKSEVSDRKNWRGAVSGQQVRRVGRTHRGGDVALAEDVAREPAHVDVGAGREAAVEDLWRDDLARAQLSTHGRRGCERTSSSVSSRRRALRAQ